MSNKNKKNSGPCLTSCVDECFAIFHEITIVSFIFFLMNNIDLYTILWL